MFIVVYASQSEDSWRALWEDLKKIVENMDRPWILAGDFNDIASISKKK